MAHGDKSCILAMGCGQAIVVEWCGHISIDKLNAQPYISRLECADRSLFLLHQFQHRPPCQWPDKHQRAGFLDFQASSKYNLAFAFRSDDGLHLCKERLGSCRISSFCKDIPHGRVCHDDNVVHHETTRLFLWNLGVRVLEMT